MRAQRRLKYTTRLLAVQARDPHRKLALMLLEAVVVAVLAHALVRPAPHVVAEARAVLLQAICLHAAASFLDALCPLRWQHVA